MTSKFAFFSVVILFFLFETNAVSTEAVTVLGSNASASDCYMSAQMTARNNVYASMSDVNNCTDALSVAGITPRDKAATYVNRGILYANLEMFDQALSDYDSANKILPNRVEVYVNRANIYYIKRIFDKAIAEYTRALELNVQKKHVIFYNRGLAYEHSDEYINAEADYRRSIELAPDWYLPNEKLERVLEKINESQPDNTEILGRTEDSESMLVNEL